MKRLFVFLLLIVTIVTLTTCGFADKYVVNTEKDPLNVRSVADSSIILGSIKKGKTVNIDYVDKYWGYLTYNGQPAKVYKEYLVPASGSSATPEKSGSSGGKSSGGKSINVGYSEPKKNGVSTDAASMIYEVNDEVRNFITVRKTKNDNGRVMGELYPGDEVYVVAVGKTWARIVYDGDYGYVKAKYIDFEGVNLPEDGELYRVRVKDGETLNVRDDEKGTVIAKISNGALVKVVEMRKTWSLVHFSMTEDGFVMNKFLVKVDD